MKNSILTFCFLFVLVFTNAQTTVIDTIFANEHKTVSMFFPEPIRQGITGSSNFAFTYNREKQQYFGLLQATPGEDSNLLVISRNGDIYSYILSYAKKLNVLSHFIDTTQRIGNEKRTSNFLKQNKLSETISDTIFKKQDTSDYPKLCAQLLKNPRPFNQVRYSKGVAIRMTKSIYYKNDVFVVFEIHNKSQIDFNINTLNLFKINGSNKRKASYQENFCTPTYKFNMAANVPKNTKVQFVYVYPKFTLGTHDKLIVRLDELNGSRDVELRLKN